MRKHMAMGCVVLAMCTVAVYSASYTVTGVIRTTNQGTASGNDRLVREENGTGTFMEENITGQARL